MSTGTVHAIADDLYLIEGHHPHNLWDDPDLPSIVVYRSGTTVYLLDTGAGPEQRESIRGLVRQYEGRIDRIVLLNSHGHLDHLGNNDLVAEIGGHLDTRHYFPRKARAGLDFEPFFTAMYKRGVPYFDYLKGLNLPAEGIASLLRALGADDALDAAGVAALGAHLEAAGVTPALSGFLPSAVVEILLQTYPPVHPSIKTMTDYEELADPTEIRIGSTRWQGWTLLDDDGDVDVHVLESEGHSAGGVVFYLPKHRFLMMADETTSVPIWADSDPRKTVRTARRALTLIDEGRLTSLCAGHRPMSVVSGDDARAALRVIVTGAHDFSACVEDAIGRRPEGITIDDLYDQLVSEARPGSIIAILVSLQFPVFSTFLKLTLLNHCLLHDLPRSPGPDGRVRFTLPTRDIPPPMPSMSPNAVAAAAEAAATPA